MRTSVKAGLLGAWLLHLALADAANGDWKQDWEKTVAAAEKIAQHPPEFQTPDGVGFVLSSLLMNEIEQAASNPVPNEWTQPIFFSERPAQLAIIGHDLIIKRKGKSK